MNAILLATLALVGLPVLLHLILRQEPRRLLFPAVRFLQQKRRINQRKLRLRHFLLLLARMLLIGLFGLTLYQPTILSQGILNLAAEQPVAVVVIVDASPSMGYTANGATRLDEARRRALELLDDLPPSSRVAILNPAEPGANWEPSVADARKRLEEFKEPSGAAVPVTTALAAAYQLLRGVDAETEDLGKLPRLVVVVTDRAAACWDATRTDDLEKLRKAVPEPDVAHLVLDVGVDQPANVGILAIELKPQVVPQGTPVTLNATLAAVGPAVPDMLVLARLVGGTAPEQKKIVAVAPGAPASVTFTYADLPPGVYQVEVRLDPARKDALAADDVRYATFRVAEARTFLTISDNPDDATYWQQAHDALGEFKVDVKRPGDVANFAGYDVVCLLNVADPGPLWPKLQAFVETDGGKLLILPGGERDVSPTAYSLKNPAAAGLLPATLAAVFDTEKIGKRNGVPWAVDDTAMRHPMLTPYRQWKLGGNVDVVVAPRVAWKFWDVESLPEASTIVSYDDNGDPKARHAAALERTVGTKGGKVVMLTTRMDRPREDAQKWSSYFDTENSWFVVLPSLLMRYLGGNPADANYQYALGQTVTVPLPKGERKKGFTVQVEGPGISGRDALAEPAALQAELSFPAAKTGTPGNYRVRTADRGFQEGFSLNAPAEESTLEKVPAEAIEALTGKDSIVPLAKAVKLRDALATKFDQPVDLFPWLLMAVLLLVAAEPVVANRFYRPR